MEPTTQPTGLGCGWAVVVAGGAVTQSNQPSIRNHLGWAAAELWLNGTNDPTDRAGAGAGRWLFGAG